jgi:hypothetical protein
MELDNPLQLALEEVIVLEVLILDLEEAFQ